jgi:hypothetical protein
MRQSEGNYRILHKKIKALEKKLETPKKTYDSLPTKLINSTTNSMITKDDSVKITNNQKLTNLSFKNFFKKTLFWMMKLKMPNKTLDYQLVQSPSLTMN